MRVWTKPFLKWTVRLILCLVVMCAGIIGISVADWYIKKHKWDNNLVVKSFKEAGVDVRDNQMLEIDDMPKGTGRHVFREFMTRHRFNYIVVHLSSLYYKTRNPQTDIYTALSVTHPLCNFHFTVFATFNAEQELENLTGKVRDAGCV